MYDKVCKSCGTYLSTFYSTGMLGCPNCYKAFEKEITSTLYRVQGGTYHAGKRPSVSSLEKELLSEYKRLIKEKERATIEGRFSDIRELAEQILSLSEELKRRGIL